MSEDKIWIDEFLNEPYRDLKPKISHKKTPHKKAVQDIIKTLHKLPGEKRIEVRNVGVTEYNGRKYTYGSPGESDIRLTWKPLIWLFPCPLSIAIEVKVGADRQRPAQKVWQEKWEQCLGLYWICSNGPEAWDKCIQAIEKLQK